MWEVVFRRHSFEPWNIYFTANDFYAADRVKELCQHDWPMALVQVRRRG